MRALVIGADGFLGANLCKALQAAGHEVTGTALNRKEHSSLEALGVVCPVEYGDVLDRRFIERAINASEAEWVFHLAAVSIVRIAQANPARALETNIMGTVNALEACRQARHVKAVVVASSDKAYGDHGGKPYIESMPLLPVAPYETSKACADLIAQSYAETYDLNVKIARCANLYGPGDLNYSRLVPNSIRRSLLRQPPIVYESAAGGYREYLYVEDAARAYIRLAECGRPGPYNVGSGEMATPAQVAEMVTCFTGGPPPVVERKRDDFSEIPAQQLDSTKMQRLRWMPEALLLGGLHSTVEWYREQL